MSEIFLGKFPKGHAERIGVQDPFLKSKFADLGPSTFVIHCSRANNETSFRAFHTSAAKQRGSLLTPQPTLATPFDHRLILSGLGIADDYYPLGESEPSACLPETH